MNNGCKTPIEDLRKQALEEYDRVSNLACSFSNFIKKAIENYNPEQVKVEPEVMPNEVVAGDIDIQLIFGEDTEKYSLWCEIVNDVYMEYDTTSDASEAEDLMHKIEKLLKLVSQREA